MHDPITPTRIIPAGAPLPTRTDPGAPPPPRPPTPPAAAPAAPPPPPPAETVVHHHVHHVVLKPPAEAVPVARRSWSWLLAWLRPWATLLGALLAVGPWFYGHSATGIWSAQLRNARTSEGIGGAYVLAGVVLAVAFLVDRGRHSWWSRALLITALIGGTGALGWYDPITALTGVHP